MTTAVVTRSQPPDDETIPALTELDRTGLIRAKLLVEMYRNDLACKGDKSPSTIATYDKRLRFFLTWLESLPPEVERTWSTDLMWQYRRHLDQTFHSPRAKNSYLVALRQFGGFLKTLFNREADPAEFVRGWKTARAPQRRPLPVADAQRFLAQLATDPRRTPLQRLRNVAMGYLMLKTGLRGIEVSRATIHDLQAGEPGQYWRLYVHGKGRAGADEWVKVLPEVYEKIAAYVAERGQDLDAKAPLFATTAPPKKDGSSRQNAGQPLGTRTIHRILTEALLLAGAKHPGIVVHSLRHSAATYALLNHANPAQVQRMMRHKHYATTEVYVSEAQQMMDGAEPAITQI